MCIQQLLIKGVRYGGHLVAAEATYQRMIGYKLNLKKKEMELITKLLPGINVII